MFLPQGGLSSERTVIYLSALRKLAFKQKQIKEITKDSKSRDHRGGVFTVFFYNTSPVSFCLSSNQVKDRGRHPMKIRLKSYGCGANIQWLQRKTPWSSFASAKVRHREVPNDSYGHLWSFTVIYGTLGIQNRVNRSQFIFPVTVPPACQI